MARIAASISEIAAPFDMTLPAVSKHLRVLENAGLMRRERDGWYHHCHIETEPLSAAVDFTIPSVGINFVGRKKRCNSAGSASGALPRALTSTA